MLRQAAQQCAMTKEQAIRHFKTQAALADRLGMQSQGSISSWGKYPPKLRQLQIEAATRGKLKAEKNCDAFRVRV